MRTFVGVAPSAAALDDLDAACAPFRTGRDDLRWTSRALWHITLAFLGEVSEETLTRLVPGLERTAGQNSAFGLSLAGAGTFSHPARAHVLWCGLSGDLHALAELAAAVSVAASGAGATPPDSDHGFTPHLTLARCRAPADVREIVASLDSYKGPDWTVAEIILIRSTLDSGLPRYLPLGRWGLRPVTTG
jgi:2'-5' RNA ligase